MKLSNSIEDFLYQLLEEMQGNIEIQRNELANRFQCVPSQINYVISTRFTTERGYVVESRRGGGGCIRIRRIEADNDSYPMQLLANLGEEITFDTSKAILQSLVQRSILTKREGTLLLTVMTDNALSPAGEHKNKLRSTILKNILIQTASHS